ncbi:MAG TPA: tRNA lysidine(34) synthetase TilS [Steroidobacteraceae bacterium]|nr:tRNA lysidine(34) synthetase TilS [Steroidobacteraceae bacterium]
MFSPSALLACIESLVPRTSAELCVAYSGGLDSTVLLHALARAIADRAHYRMRAAHVDHQLHPDSASWRGQCGRVAQSLQVEFVPLIVSVAASAEMGVEAAAREARYAALREILKPNEVLLTAHHADDQLETMLMALLRGAGLRGLSGVPSVQIFGGGWLARPLLEFGRAELEEWARAEQLQWLEDPSNVNTSFDRNFLRHRVLPALRERWPAAAHSATRSTAHLREAGRLLDMLAAADLETVAIGACLALPRLASLAPARRRNVLRHWIRQQGMRVPSTRKLATIERDLLIAREDRLPCVEWDGVQVRRHRGLLYCMRQRPSFEPADTLAWNVSQVLELPAQLGRLRVQRDALGGLAVARLPEALQVHFRHGGEELQPAGDAHHRKLKKLLQDARVLPWWRDRVPLIYAAERLVAVGDLWIAEEFAARGGEDALRIVWEERPQLVAMMTSG